jgi:hypothetical protein
MNPAFNPQPTYPCNPDQLDIFCFMTKKGFAGIEFTDVQGFMADCDDDSLASFGSRVFVKSQDVCYPAVESVPELVARYADMKRRRDAALNANASASASKPAALAPTWKSKA